ncbi:unnamed protein product [Trifolium pratense]|uniref:Uncharacterized protein n=1 Tax=Trifolium pratense TaxID=57577 RepID=A0ACB0JW46_TRIPR|nr:unnamed protein product [Trifolium pratense]
MASGGYGLAETYVMQKLYKEKILKSIEHEEKQEDMRKTNTEIGTVKMGSMDKTSSRCFSWLPKQQHKKISRISDSNDS